MVRLAVEAVVDARPGDHQLDLDDPLPDHRRQLRVRLLPGVLGPQFIAKDFKEFIRTA